MLLSESISGAANSRPLMNWLDIARAGWTRRGAGGQNRDAPLASAQNAGLGGQTAFDTLPGGGQTTRPAPVKRTFWAVRLNSGIINRSVDPLSLQNTGRVTVTKPLLCRGL